MEYDLEYRERPRRPIFTRAPIQWGPTKWWNRTVAKFPFRADVPMETVPPISRVIEPCVVINLKRKDAEPIQRWAFKKRSHRDQFVAAWKHVGAQNTR